MDLYIMGYLPWGQQVQVLNVLTQGSTSHVCPDLINRCRFHGQLILKFLLGSLFKIRQMYLKVTKWFDKKALHSKYVIYYWRGAIHTDHRHQNLGGWGEGQALLSPHQIRILRTGENGLSFFWGEGPCQDSDKSAPPPIFNLLPTPTNVPLLITFYLSHQE